MIIPLYTHTHTHTPAPASTVVTGAADLSEDNKAVIIGAAVGAVVGLIIVGGAVVAISVLLAVCFVYLAKKREKNFTPE